MIDKFSWSRVWFLIRRYFNENFRQLWMTLGVMFGIMLFFSITINRTIGNIGSDAGIVLWLIFFGIISFALTVVGSLTFSSMSTKPRRIVAMMVPASKSEKFVSLLIIYNIFAPLLIVFSALLVDALTSAIFLHEPFFIYLLRHAGDFLAAIRGDSYGIEIFFGIMCGVGGSLTCSMATYTLGSSIWPKKSFIKTFCVLFAIQVFMPFFVPIDFAASLIRWIRDIDIDAISVHVMAWSGVALIYLFAAFLYWLAWRRYRSTQLIQKFMMD